MAKYFINHTDEMMSLPDASDGKESAYNAGDQGSITGSGRSPGEGNGNPLQYCCLENSMEGRAWWATVHGVVKSRTRLSDFTFTFTSKEHPGLISFRMDWLDLLAVQGTLKSLLQHHTSKASILWCPAFFILQISHHKCCCCCCCVSSVMSDSMQPHRWQPTRLHHPWDSPDKNTGVGCHFLLQCMKMRSESEVAQSCPTLHHPIDCSLPGFSVHGIFQARVLEWGAIAFSRKCQQDAKRTEDLNRCFFKQDVQRQTTDTRKDAQHRS